MFSFLKRFMWFRRLEGGYWFKTPYTGWFKSNKSFFDDAVLLDFTVEYWGGE